MENARFVLEDGTIEYEGPYRFRECSYVGKGLMTKHCNVPRKVISDEIIDNVRVIKLDLFENC